MDDAELFSRCIDSRSLLATTASQSTLPEEASMRASRRSPFSAADVRKTLFAQTIGTPYRVSEERVRRVLDELELQ